MSKELKLLEELRQYIEESEQDFHMLKLIMDHFNGNNNVMTDETFTELYLEAYGEKFVNEQKKK